MKKFLGLVIVCFSVLGLKAEWLWWSVDFTGANESDVPWYSSSGSTYAWLTVRDTSGNTIYNSDALTTGTEDETSSMDLSGELFEGNTDWKTKLSSEITQRLDGSSTYLFYIELGNTINGSASWTTKGYTYDELQAAHAITTTDIEGTGFVMKPFTAVGVPEPTSGLLLIVGAALLGLRRRRA